MGDLVDENESDEEVKKEVQASKTVQTEAVTHAHALVDEELEIWNNVGLNPMGIGMPGLTITYNFQAITEVLIDKGLITEEELEVIRLTKMLEILRFQRKEQEKIMEAQKRAALGLGPKLVGPNGEPILH